MIERDYVSVGGSLERFAPAARISAARHFRLSSCTGQPGKPVRSDRSHVHYRGIGRRVARKWAERIREQLGLDNKQVSFLLYHSESDEIHFERLDAAVQSGILTEPLVKEIVKTRQSVARLYALQLEELGNF